MRRLDESQDTIRVNVSLTKRMYEAAKRIAPARNVSFLIRELLQAAMDKDRKKTP